VSLLAGHFLFHRRFTGLPRPDQLDRLVLLRYLGEYLAGSIVLAIFAGILSLILAFLAATTLKRLRGNARC
jgi:ABC-type Fe3+ transport system permease subunit